MLGGKGVVVPAQAVTDALFGSWLVSNQARIEAIIADVKAGRLVDIPTVSYSHMHPIPSPRRAGSSYSDSSSPSSTPHAISRDASLTDAAAVPASPSESADAGRFTFDESEASASGIARGTKVRGLGSGNGRSPQAQGHGGHVAQGAAAAAAGAVGAAAGAAAGTSATTTTTTSTPPSSSSPGSLSPPTIRVPPPSQMEGWTGVTLASNGSGGSGGPTSPLLMLPGRPPLSPTMRTLSGGSAGASPSRRARGRSDQRGDWPLGASGSSGGAGLSQSPGSGGRGGAGETDGAPTWLIPPFFERGARRRARVPVDPLEGRLADILEVWRGQHAELLRKHRFLADLESALHNVQLGAASTHRGSSAASAAASAAAAAAAAHHSLQEVVQGVEVSVVDAGMPLCVEQFAAVAKALCGFPSFFAAPLFRRIRRLYGSGSLCSPHPRAPGSVPARAPAGTGGGVGVGVGVGTDDDATLEGVLQGYDPESRGVVRLRAFLAYWRQELEEGDAADRLVRVIAQPTRAADETPAMVAGDFMPFLEELLAFHPGLAFLEATPEFQEKYARTVVARIFYHLDPDGTQRITARQVRRAKPSLVQAFQTVDMEEDINAVTHYFSYEHFYVLYCKFWELDDDRDFLLRRADLSKLQNLTEVCLDRVFAGAGRRRLLQDPERMGYEDFVHFFISEEDKTTDVALQYWFRVVDVDGDGVISVDDVKYFYKEQFARMQELGLEAVKLHDLVTQMTDLLSPAQPGRFLLDDFLHATRIKLTGVFFSALFNITKFQAFEARDPVLVKQELNAAVSQWDRFASLEYMRLADEEERGAQDEAAMARIATSAHDRFGPASSADDDLVNLMRKTAVK